MTREPDDLELGKRALEFGLLRKEDLEEALQRQSLSPGSRLGDVLKEMNLLKQEEVDTLLLKPQKPAAEVNTVISDHGTGTPGSSPALGKDFGDFILLEERGRGGMGIVYKARQKNLDRLVAIKILPPEKAEVPQFQKRFEREAKALAALSHPYIVGIHDFGRRGSYFYLVMEYVEGLSLRELLRDSNISEEEIYNILGQICDALEYAHRHGIIHRDIKPDNILIDKEGRVRVADFGLAKLGESSEIRERSLTQSGAIMGTMNYMAPEQIEDSGDVDSRADIYSTGVLFYELLTGELPIGSFDPPSKKGIGNSNLDKIVIKALAKDPKNRYQTASDLKEDLDRASSTEPPPESRKKGHLAWLSIPLALLLLGVIFFLWKERPETAPEPVEKPWSESFRSISPMMEFARFDGASNRKEEIREVLDRMPPEEEPLLLKWFEGELSRVPAKRWPKSEWTSRKTESLRIRSWASALMAFLTGKGDGFDPVRRQLKEIDARFAVVVSYQGSIDLTFFFSPYGEIRDLRAGEEWIIREGKKVSSGARIVGETLVTPLVIRGIDIGKLSITVTHPELGTKKLTLPAEGLKNGGAYLCSGSLRKPEAITLKPLP